MQDDPGAYDALPILENGPNRRQVLSGLGCIVISSQLTSCTLAEVVGGSEGGEVSFDIAQETYQALATPGGLAAVWAEENKFATYGNALRDDYHFVPIAVETFGSWGPIGHKFITDIGRTIAGITKNPKSTSFIFQAISMAVQRGNVQCVQGAYGDPAFEELDEIFYIHCKYL